MGTVHQLISAKGRQAALDFGLERPEVDEASAYLADEDTGIGFLYSGWCQAALPHPALIADRGYDSGGFRAVLVDRCGEGDAEIVDRDHQTVRSGEGVRGLPEALGRGTDIGLAEPLPPTGKGFRKLDANGRRVLRLASIRLMLRRSCNS